MYLRILNKCLHPSEVHARLVQQLSEGRANVDTYGTTIVHVLTPVYLLPVGLKKISTLQSARVDFCYSDQLFERVLSMRLD